MATVKLKIRDDRKEFGLTTIYVQYVFQGRKKLFSTGQKVDPEFWDGKKEQVKKGFAGYTRINSIIVAKREEIKNIVFEAERRKESPTFEYMQTQVAALSSTIQSEVKKDFFELYEEFIKDAKVTKAESTLKQHRNTINHLKSFSAKRSVQVTLESVDMGFYERFTSYLYTEKAFGNNTVAKCIKNIKTFLNYLTAKGLNQNLTYQKREFKKPSAPTDIIYLTRGELESLLTADLSNNKRLERIRDVFVFECTTGLRYSDMANLKPENLKSDQNGSYLDLTTIKTKDRLLIPLNQYALQILARNQEKLPQPISNQKMNDYLKELGKVCQIDEQVQIVKYVGSKRIELVKPKYELITTHTARRTFVTQSLERGIRPEIIMKITGHKDIKTMMKYVKITDNVVRAEMMRGWN